MRHKAALTQSIRYEQCSTDIFSNLFDFNTHQIYFPYRFYFFLFESFCVKLYSEKHIKRLSWMRWCLLFHFVLRIIQPTIFAVSLISFEKIGTNFTHSHRVKTDERKKILLSYFHNLIRFVFHRYSFIYWYHRNFETIEEK